MSIKAHVRALFALMLAATIALGVLWALPGQNGFMRALDVCMTITCAYCWYLLYTVVKKLKNR